VGDLLVSVGDPPGAGGDLLHIVGGRLVSLGDPPGVVGDLLHSVGGLPHVFFLEYFETTFSLISS
jgi:hypothetical protein